MLVVFVVVLFWFFLLSIRNLSAKGNGLSSQEQKQGRLVGHIIISLVQFLHPWHHHHMFVREPGLPAWSTTTKASGRKKQRLGGPGPKAYKPWIKDLVRDLGANLLPAVEDDQHSPPYPLSTESDGAAPTHVARPPRWTVEIVHTQFKAG